jgi:hypothetical protein
LEIPLIPLPVFRNLRLPKRRNLIAPRRKSVSMPEISVDKYGHFGFCENNIRPAWECWVIPAESQSKTQEFSRHEFLQIRIFGTNLHHAIATLAR